MSRGDVPLRQLPFARALPASLAVGLAATLGNALLWRLSQFGQHPYPVLPPTLVTLFGLLFTGLLVDLTAGLSGRRSALTLLLAAALGVTAALLVPFAEVRYALAPLVAVAAAALLKLGLRRHAAMLAAMTVYVSCTLLANYTFDSFLPVGGFFLLNVGTLFFGVTFTQRDRVHGFGRRAVYAMILSAALANVLLSSHLGTPLRYVGVSFLSIMLSETADTEIYQRLIHRRWITRVASSNAVSAPMDTLVFTLLAFVGQDFATPHWLLQVIATDIVVKYGSSMVAATRMFELPARVARRLRPVDAP
ncbi:MAG TPA: VUT family protein [Trueperaceae bacterium]|nr:VUT family protein [Trueperaceae bacterium]